MKKAAVLVFVFVIVAFSLPKDAVAADGKALYSVKGKCASCHGEDGKSKETIAKMLKVDISKLVLVGSKKSDAELEKIIADGVKDTRMKGYSDKLSGDEISDVVKYIRTLK